MQPLFPCIYCTRCSFLFAEYKITQLLTFNEELLMNGAEYCLVTDPNEIGDADFAYEIKSGSSQEDICGIISSICGAIKNENGLIHARYENGEYIIFSDNTTIGRIRT